MSPLDDPAAVFLYGFRGFRFWPLAFADDGDGIAIPGASDAQPVGIVALIHEYQQEYGGQPEQQRDDPLAFIAVGGRGIDGKRAGVAIADGMNGAAFAFIANTYAITAAASWGKKSRLSRPATSRSGRINRQTQACPQRCEPMCRLLPSASTSDANSTAWPIACPRVCRTSGSR